ncbi:SpoIIE family protein phosphatase [Paracrocinitomix mangrovi]|uniref:SpoIIE family protein phosphatase n=1 Tax=Paracrocinitomix mangrovi TaxID=2862509 RepID=UPI001C8E9A5A|nr:SpoIIE family protein phosphatase [Paracrocinitomix mangrovi]UKN02177.1 SpoIIE family protein phosphatase [Paracrocinitomix mangrovi]
MNKLILFILGHLIACISYSQDLEKLDSLEQAFQNENDSEKKARLAIEIAHETNHVDNDKAEKYAVIAINLAEKTENPEIIAESKSVRAMVYGSNGNFKKSVELELEALHIYEELNDYRKVASTTNNIANAYLGIDDYEKSEEYYKKSYDAAIICRDTNAMAVPLVGMSILYEQEGKTEEALKRTSEAAGLFESINRIDAMIVCYFNAADYAYSLKRHDEAENWLEKARKTNELIGNKYYSGSIKMMESRWAANDKKYNEAIINANLAIEDFKFINAQLDVKRAYKSLSEIYADAGKYRDAYQTILKFDELKDSLNEVNQAKAMEEMNAKYDKANNEKKIAALSHQAALSDLENKSSKRLLNFAIGGSAVLLVLVIVALNAYFQKQKTAAVLADKNMIIEEKNREILDSIRYAKRIQNAIIPSDDIVNRYLANSFVYYRPKDIVAGDFYWMEIINNKILFAVADCTGHGVPGAMVSVVCNNALNRAVREFNLEQPGKILDKTKELVVETFSKSKENVRDGMDITLCCWDPKTNEIEWAGANNPLYIIRKESEELEIINPDKQPIGQFENSYHYTNHKVNLFTGDTLYLFSDGFVDQFGGLEGKKYKYARFRNFLLSHFKKNMKEQHDLFEHEFLSWKGELEQLDDICIIGVRV